MDENLEIPTNIAPEKLKAKINALGHEKLMHLIISVNEQQSTFWQKQTLALLSVLDTYQILEVAGKVINLRQFKLLLDEMEKEGNDGHWKLAPLLVNFSHELFSELISSASNAHLNALKQEAITEPVQHHLTILTHEIMFKIPEILKELEEFENQINSLQVAELDIKELKHLYHRLDRYALYLENLIHKINKILQLVWNTQRSDLIEKLSHAREVCQKMTLLILGDSQQRNHSLYFKLEERLSQVYGSKNDINAANDDEPAIEALAKLSLWYLKDYWHLGLLPKVLQEKDLELNAETASVGERMAHRELLLNEAFNNLSKLGLKTVRDLKENQIFSKEALIDFIQRKKIFF